MFTLGFAASAVLIMAIAYRIGSFLGGPPWR